VHAMRMKELESQTGVNRETVRYYIREGLLPEPDRKGKTSARYSETHVAKLKAIKRLQDERHLPLSVIRALLDNGNAQTSLAATAFPDLEADLSARLAQRSTAAERVDRLAKRIGLSEDDLAQLVQEGMLRVHVQDDGQPWVKGVDVLLAERCAALKAAGFTEERGFGPETFRMYLEFTEWLVGEELRLFLNNMAGRVGSAEVANAAERGIDIMNEVLALLRTRSVMEKMQHALLPQTNDNP
jgi:DNA-binding transcriptional MerR regulator